MAKEFKITKVYKISTSEGGKDEVKTNYKDIGIEYSEEAAQKRIMEEVLNTCKFRNFFDIELTSWDSGLHIWVKSLQKGYQYYITEVNILEVE